MATRKDEERAKAIKTLREWLPKGAKVYTALSHVSSSGMTRGIKVLAVVDGGLMDLSYWVSKAIEYRLHSKGGLKVTGCGMDMGFHVVYSLALVLYGYDPETKEWINPRAGYELKQEWV